MRYLRIAVVILLIFSLGFALWANNRYYSKVNRDYPQIETSIDMLQISVQDPEEALFQGLTAQDETDGDLTDQIIVASASHFLQPGTVNVKYVVFDSHNNSATLTRKVCYTDYEPPKFYLEKAPVYTVGSSFDLLNHIRVEDCIDGDISDHVRVISNLVNNFTVGEYPVVLEVFNSCGDTAQITLWVTYQAKENSAKVKLNQHIVYVQQDGTFDPDRHLAAVTDANGIILNKDNVEIQGNLDLSQPGCYQLTYSYDDGHLSGQSPLTVVVTERQA